MTNGLVIVPTYNERENIERLVRAIMSLSIDFDLLVVDDQSPDGTGDIVRDLMNEFPDRLYLEQRNEKAGLGTAYIHGFRYALARNYTYLFEMDADFSHNPNDLVRLYQACTQGGADLAIGSRYINGVNVINWPMSRVLMSYFASAYVRFITGMPIKDATAGFKCYKADVIRTIGLDSIRFIGYAFQIEMKFRAWKHGFNLIEVPIIFTDRTHGESKMSPRIFKEAFWGVIKLRIKSLFTKFSKSKIKNTDSQLVKSKMEQAHLPVEVNS